MSDDADLLGEREEREAARFAAALKAQRERPLPMMNTCIDCGEILEVHRRAYGRCFFCAYKRETRLGRP